MPIDTCMDTWDINKETKTMSCGKATYATTIASGVLKWTR